MLGAACATYVVLACCSGSASGTISLRVLILPLVRQSSRSKLPRLSMPGAASTKHPRIHVSSGCTVLESFIAAALASMKE